MGLVLLGRKRNCAENNTPRELTPDEIKGQNTGKPTKVLAQP